MKILQARRKTLTVIAGFLTATLVGFVAKAQDRQASSGIPQPSIATSLPDQGDPAGVRKWLAGHGIVYSLIYTNDVLANVRGGLRRGAIDQGKLEATLAVDLEKLAGFRGLSFFSNMFQIHNTGRIRRDYVGGVGTIAAIEAVPTTRLSELWLEQKSPDGLASVRVGQLAADVEFFCSELSALFLQGDWPTIAAVNLPSGGPSYPLSTPGVRVKLDPAPDLSLLLAVFNGDPVGPGPGDEQVRNRHGLNARVRDPALMMAEVQYRRNQDPRDAGLATTIKLGGWYHFGQFGDQRLAFGAFMLAGPGAFGSSPLRRGNSGIYAIVDQQIYRPAGGDAKSGISVFTRGSVSPSDRNLIDAVIDGGVIFSGLTPNRPDDQFGVAFIHTRYSDHVRIFDSEATDYAETLGPARRYETNLELTYAAQVIPGWTVQPTAQFIRHPGGGTSRNAAVVGARSIWRF